MNSFNKLITVIALYICIQNTASANDTVIQKQIGGNEYQLSDTKQITIESELLIISLYDTHYEVSVEYDFYNSGSSITVDMGFPIYKYIYATEDIKEKNVIRNFKSKVDNILTPIEIVPSSIDLSTRERITAFYKKQVRFNEKSHVRIINSYTASYGNSYGNDTVEYLVGSAVTWNSIKKLTIQTILYSQDLYLQYMPELGLQNKQLPNNTNVIFDTNKRLLELIYIQPQIVLSSTFSMYLGRTSYNWVYGLPWDYDFENTIYPIEGFRMLTNDQLRLTRNLVFAWHGYLFKDKTLEDFFNETAWYNNRKKLDYRNESFNDYELKNLELIKIVESERK